MRLDPVSEVKKLLEQENLLRPDARLCCAVSGGADSMALLTALILLQNSYGFALSALHIQHHLRGEDSLADEAFVTSWCNQRQIPIRIRNADIQGSMKDPGMEKIARDARRRIFLEVLEKEEVLLLAHHQDDQAETVLMHMLRGAGAEGLSGMKKVSRLGELRVLRPFLKLSKQELLHFLEREAIPHREDQSNAEPSNPRNLLRLRIIPELERLFPGVSRRIAENAATLALESDELGKQALAAYRAMLVQVPPLFALKRASLQVLPEAILRRVLRIWIREGYRRAGASEDEQTAHFEETLALSNLILEGKSGRINLSHDLKAELGTFLLVMDSQHETEPFEPFEINLCQETQFRYLGCLWRTLPSQKKEAPKDRFCVVIPQKYQQAVFRTPRSGDRIQSFGSSGHKEYRRYLTDLRLDHALRPVWPVLAIDHEILWVPGFCTSELLRWKEAHEHDLEIILCDGFLADMIKNKGV